MKGCLRILREIKGVRTSTPTAILLAELGLKALSDEWLLRAAKLWNSLAALPLDGIYQCIVLAPGYGLPPCNINQYWTPADQL